MTEIKDIIDDIGIVAFENNIKIAALAVMSNSGNIIYQTENFNLSNQENDLLNAMKGIKSFKINDQEYLLEGADSEGIIGTNTKGMGYILLLPFQGGILVSYALPQAEPTKALEFLKNFTIKLNGQIS